WATSSGLRPTRPGERDLMDRLGLMMVDTGLWGGADRDTCTMQPAPSVQEFQQVAKTHEPDLYLFNYTADEIGQCKDLEGTIKQCLNLTGLFYWGIDRWTSDPWKNVNNRGMFGEGNYPGEGVLVYPGQPAGVSGVVPSIRLKQLRDGIEDYEYVEILKKLGRGQWAVEMARSVAPDWANWRKDPGGV